MSFFTSTTITFGLTKNLCLFNADQNSVILFFLFKNKLFDDLGEGYFLLLFY